MQSSANFITAAEAAEMIEVTPQAVRDLIRAGKLPGWKKISSAPNAPFVGPRSSVEAYLQARKSKEKSE